MNNSKKAITGKAEDSNIRGINTPEDTRRFVEWIKSNRSTAKEENGMVHIPVWTGSKE